MKAITGAAAALRPTHAALSRAYGCPLRGTRVTPGLHVDMPATWDGNGECPPGWTKEAVAIHFGPVDAALPVPDDVATYAQQPEAQARMSVAERALVANAISNRVEKDLTEYFP